MRAVLSATVRHDRTADDGGPHSGFASRGQIREALSGRGLTPPPLLRYRRDAEHDLDDVSERILFRGLATVVGAAASQREFLNPDDLLVEDDSRIRAKARLVNYVDAAKEHIPADTAEQERRALEGLASFALPVLMRMPSHSVEDRDKRRSAADSLLFASRLTPTRTLFVVSSENEEAVTFRLHHQLIERLQKGCEDLITKLSQPIPVRNGTITFTFESPVEIYEVGQEDPTILGEIVGTTLRARWKYARRKERISYAVLAVLFVVFSGLVAYLVAAHLGQPVVDDAIVTTTGGQYVRRDDGFWIGQAQRLQSGVIPVLLVTAITLVIRFPRGVVISWIQRYGNGS